MKKYIIPKNKHRINGLNIGYQFSNKLFYSVIFDKTALYDDYDTNDSINKLFGFSTSYHHHHQSVRIGWKRIDNENIGIYTYTYDDGKRVENHHLLGIVKIDENFVCGIQYNKTSVVYYFKGEKDLIYTSYKRSLNKTFFKIKYRLYPYFGGSNKTKKDIKIMMKKIKYI